MKTRTIASSIFFLCAATLVLPSSARADADLSVPGAACQQMFDFSTAAFVHLSSGVGYNNTASSMAVTCPVQRNVPGTSSGIWAAIWVNNPAGKTTSCTVSSIETDGTGVDSETQSVTGTGFQALYFSNVNSTGGWGSLTVSCTLPARGFINDYYVYEYS